MEKAAQTPNGAPHRRRRRRPTGNGSVPQAQQPAREGKAPAQPRKPAPQAAPAAAKAPRNENAPRGGNRPRRGQAKPAQQPQSQQAPRQNTPAQRPAAPQNAPQNARTAAPQPQRRTGRTAPQIPSQPLRDQPKASRPARSARPPRSTASDQPGLDLISRRPPKQKFANFEDYLAAHGGMTVPLPDEPAETTETAKPAEAAE